MKRDLSVHMYLARSRVRSVGHLRSHGTLSSCDATTWLSHLDWFYVLNEVFILKWVLIGPIPFLLLLQAPCCAAVFLLTAQLTSLTSLQALALQSVPWCNLFAVSPGCVTSLVSATLHVAAFVPPVWMAVMTGTFHLSIPMPTSATQISSTPPLYNFSGILKSGSWLTGGIVCSLQQKSA